MKRRGRVRCGGGRRERSGTGRWGTRTVEGKGWHKWGILAGIRFRLQRATGTASGCVAVRASSQPDNRTVRRWCRPLGVAAPVVPRRALKSSREETDAPRQAGGQRWRNVGGGGVGRPPTPAGTPPTATAAARSGARLLWLCAASAAAEAACRARGCRGHVPRPRRAEPTEGARSPGGLTVGATESKRAGSSSGLPRGNGLGQPGAVGRGSRVQLAGEVGACQMQCGPRRHRNRRGRQRPRAGDGSRPGLPRRRTRDGSASIENLGHG